MDEFQVIYQVSARRILKLFKFSRSTYYYKQVEDHQAIIIKQKIKDIAAVRVRYGYRRINVLLKREGIVVNHKRLYRLYCQLGLQLRNKVPRRRVQAVARRNYVQAEAKNDCWSMDFMSDHLFTGSKIRLLTIVDNYTKISPAIGVGSNYRGTDVVMTLEKAVLQ